MSLKQEIDLIVASEKAKLEVRDRIYDQYREEQSRNFSPLLALLKEIESSFSREHMDIKIEEERMAFVSVGLINELNRLTESSEKIFRDEDYRCFIEPNRELVESSEHEGYDYRPRPGFRTEDKDEYGNLRINVFESESDVAQFLIKIISKRVAEYEHGGK